MQKAKIQVIVWKSQKNIIPPVVLVEVIEFIIHKYWLLHILHNLERNSLNQFFEENCARRCMPTVACLNHLYKHFKNLFNCTFVHTILQYFKLQISTQESLSLLPLDSLCILWIWFHSGCKQACYQSCWLAHTPHRSDQ